MTTTKPFQLGSISTGTPRPEDLLTNFANRLARSSPDHECLKQYYWSDGEAWLEALTEALQELCPPFVYFGAHPDDGADYGFWPDHDGIAEALLDISANDADADWEEFILDETIITLFDTGYVTVLDLDREVLWSTV